MQIAQGAQLRLNGSTLTLKRLAIAQGSNQCVCIATGDREPWEPQDAHVLSLAQTWQAAERYNKHKDTVQIDTIG